MLENVCQQCNNVSVGPSSRLVQDSCGHKKCRVCLLEDEEKCEQCEAETIIKQNGEVKEKNDLIVSKDSVIKFESNHSVIQCNGNPQLNIDKNKCNVGVLDEKCIVKTKEPALKQELTTNNAPKKLNKFKIKKPAKKVLKREHKSINIPSHVTETAEPPCYHCNLCRKSFYTRVHVKYHLYCDQNVKPFKCTVCEKEFVLKVQLDVHMFKHNDLKPFSCNVCQKRFNDKTKLNRHMPIHSSTKAFICSECCKSFKSKDSLRIHSYIHKGVKPFSCKVCPSKFSNRANLSKHMASHSKEKVHMCDQCGKRFKLKWALTVHQKSHLRVRPHECTICSKTFVNNKDLQRHSLVHSETKGYTCSICRTSFRRKDNLNRHMKNAHPGKKGDVIKNVVKPPDIPSKKPVVDHPNAINVITASPAFSQYKPVGATTQQPVKCTDYRPVNSVINGPIKLAFKTPAFKSNYNINRDFNYIPTNQMQKPFDLAKSVDICQKILSPHTASLPRKVSPETKNTELCQTILSPNSVPTTKVDEPTSTEICQKILSPYSVKTPKGDDSASSEVSHRILSPYDVPTRVVDESMSTEIYRKILSPYVNRQVDEPTSTEICRKILSPYASRHVDEPTTYTEVCQKILSPYSNPGTPLHYETSFQNRKHALIKNIKFKVPMQYTTNFNKSDSSTTRSQPVDVTQTTETSNEKTYTELKPVVEMAPTSVIVNNSLSQASEVHWRRRTSQNLTLKN